jgi:hypothetical protein
MDPTPYLPVIASLLGGGAVGAVITMIATTFRGRKQPVGRRIDISPVFTTGFSGSTLSTNITINDGVNNYNFPNLYVADIQIVNRGNRDFATFTFGITLGQPDKAIHVEPYGIDRHHIVDLKTACTPAAPNVALDFELKPFHRGDSYTMKVFFTVGGQAPEQITLSSAEAVRFADIQSLAETIAKTAQTTAFKFGPFEIRIP